MSRATLTSLIGFAVALLLAGCDTARDRPVEVAVIGDAASPFVQGARLPLAAQLVRSATAEGLVGFDERGRVIPALADRWIVTDDGLSYIFRLRDGAWPDKTALTGETARAALLQALASVRGTALGADLGAIEEVRAMAGRVVEIRLRQAQPDFLQLLAQPELGLLRKGRGAGPMRMTREKRSVLLKPIAPEDRGLPRLKTGPNGAATCVWSAFPARAQLSGSTPARSTWSWADAWRTSRGSTPAACRAVQSGSIRWPDCSG